MKRVETSEATRSRGGDGMEPERSPESTWSVVALVSEGTGDVGRARSLVHKGWTDDSTGKGGGRQGGEIIDTRVGTKKRRARKKGGEKKET